jgi:hypothetical protein
MEAVRRTQARLQPVDQLRFAGDDGRELVFGERSAVRCIVAVQDEDGRVGDRGAQRGAFLDMGDEERFAAGCGERE